MKNLKNKLIHALYMLLIAVLFTGCENDKFVIEQTYFIGEHKTYVWSTYGMFGEKDRLSASWSIERDSVSCEKIEENLRKAQEWINRVEKCN